MPIGTGLAPSGYNPAPAPFALPTYDPTGAQPRRVVAGGGGGGGGARSLPPSIVEYKPPEYNEQQVQAYQQEALAPALGALRRGLREVQAGRFASPSARREALRGAVRGYGEALAPLQVGAGAQARQRYDIQYRQDILAEQQRVAAEERLEEREYRESLRDEATAERAGLTPSGYQDRHRAFQYIAPEQPHQVVGLTEASRRPISAEPVYGGTRQPTSVAPGAAYPENWMQ